MMQQSAIAVDTNNDSTDRETIESENASLEEEDVYFLDIEILLEHNISEEDVKMLKKTGINTIKGVHMAMRKKLLSIPNFDDAKVDKIKEICCKLTMNNVFVSAMELSDQRKQIFKLTTGSTSFE